MWKTFAYHVANYAMVMLPSHTSGDKILYTLSYKAEIGLTILGLVKCAYVIYGTFARCTALAVRNPTRVPVYFAANSPFL